MDIGKIIKLAKPLIAKAGKLAKKELERKPALLKVMKKFGLSKLEARPESIYCHALMEFSIEALPGTAWFFAKKGVIEAFHDEKLKKGDNAFMEALKLEFRCRDEDAPIEKNLFIDDFSEMKPEIQRFREIYESVTLKTTTPMMLKMYNVSAQFPTSSPEGISAHFFHLSQYCF